MIQRPALVPCSFFCSARRSRNSSDSSRVLRSAGVITRWKPFIGFSGLGWVFFLTHSPWSLRWPGGHDGTMRRPLPPPWETTPYISGDVLDFATLRFSAAGGNHANHTQPDQPIDGEEDQVRPRAQGGQIGTQATGSRPTRHAVSDEEAQVQDRDEEEVS